MPDDLKGVEDALERLVLYTAMEDGQLALNCERIIKTHLSRIQEENERKGAALRSLLLALRLTALKFGFDLTGSAAVEEVEAALAEQGGPGHG